MIKERFRSTLIFLLVICFIVALTGVSRLRAEDDDGNADKTASWYQTQYGTSPWGGTWMMGQFGPDVGYGQQGTEYQYTNPRTGAYISYSSTGIGMGLGGLFAGYGGWDSPLAAISYGPFAYGSTPLVAPTPGYGTQGYASGGLFAPQTSFYQAQPGLLWMLGGGLGNFGNFGLFGGYSGYGGYGGYSGYGGYGGYPFGFAGWF